jgi:5-methylcytosine-specific restriction enzyme B
MPSSLRVILPSAQPAYAAALRWRDEALVDDRSLFDGRPIDGLGAAAELRTYFIDQPDAGAGDFRSKLRGQLSSASTDTVQVAAELLYVHTLISSTLAVSSSTKRKLVDGVIGFRESGTSPIPDSLLAALDGGMAHPGQAYNSYRWKMFGYLIELFGRLKALLRASRREVVTTYEAFEGFVGEIDEQSVWSQRYAIEHLLFPDIAPAILSRDDRGRIAASLGNGADASQVGSVLAHLQPNMHYGRQSSINAYRTPYRERWEGLKPAMETYSGWARRLATVVDLDREERQYKLERVPLLLEAFDAADSGRDVSCATSAGSAWLQRRRLPHN